MNYKYVRNIKHLLGLLLSKACKVRNGKTMFMEMLNILSVNE